MDSEFQRFFKDMPNSEKGKSFFEQEALRAAALNKNKKKDSDSWHVKLIAGSLVGGVVVLLYVPLVIYSVFAHGFVGMKLWNWFVLGHIPGAPAMTITNMCGIALILRLLTYENPYASTAAKEKDEFSDKVIRFIGLILIPWMSLLVGYILHRMM